MKKTVVLVFVMLMTSSLIALETGFTTEFGNYGISDYDSSSTEYIPYFQWAANLFYYDTAGLNEDLQYGFELDRDIIKGYSIAAELKFKQPYYTIAFGPVFGVINETYTLVKPGFSGMVRGEWPGRIYLELKGDMIPAQYVGAKNDYSTYSGSYTLGFYLRQNHILCYFTQALDNYASLSGTDPYTDSSLSYIFYANFFEKGALFKIETKLGYEILNRTFQDSSDVELKNILFGLRSDFYINPKATVFIGFDNKIYPVSSGSIELSDVPFYQITVVSGFKWSQ
ncbi:MAG: hypothetical protein PQJ58_20225 [Spirochaetales bacterium]|nr:hypothetical protein [Spirochaetales bacterium]